MAAWIAAIIISAIIGNIAGLIENYLRDSPIPDYHIIIVGTVGGVIGGVVAMAVAGRPMLGLPIVLSILFLAIDRATEKSRRGL